MSESYFGDEDRALAASLVGAIIEVVELVGTNEEFTFPHIDLRLVDGRCIRVGGVWHNDSTAGAYLSLWSGSDV